MLAFGWTAATSFSTVPLRISMIFGIVIGLFALEEGVRALAGHFLGNTVSGWTSLMVVTALIGSSMLISIGLVGEYVAKLYEEAKGRPVYFVARTFKSSAPAGATNPKKTVFATP